MGTMDQAFSSNSGALTLPLGAFLRPQSLSRLEDVKVHVQYQLSLQWILTALKGLCILPSPLQGSTQGGHS